MQGRIGIDPLNLKTTEKKLPPLLLGEYVRVNIEGRLLENVFSIPLMALRDNESIWIAGDDGKLHIRKIAVLWRDIHSVILKDGINEGERIIVSNLAAPIDGMPVQLDDSSDEPVTVRSKP